MKIIVLNGSPKGDLSITMQYVHFLDKTFGQHELKILNITQQIKAIEKSRETFGKIVGEIREADGVVWAFPVYFLLVPSGYKRFIELIAEHGAEEAFKDKYTVSLSTSVHYYDHVAHNYINAVCEDLDMNYAGWFSADMYDLLKKEERARLNRFFEHFLLAIETAQPMPKNFLPLIHNNFEYLPGDRRQPVDTGGRKVLVLTDSKDTTTNLGRMIGRFSESFSSGIEMVDLNEIDIKGGCLGCIRCGYDNRCLYDDKDGYVEFFETQFKTADVVIIAGSITDRYLSSRWKLFFDRSFFNNHKPLMKGKAVGFIISGPLGQVPNLRQALEAFYEMQEASIVDFITDECCDSVQIDALLLGLAQRALRFVGEGYARPASFLGIGGHKVLRDDVFGRLRFPFRADHRYFKKNKLYDFPQKNLKNRLMNATMSILCNVPSIRKEIYNRRIKREMIKPLQRVLEND